MKMHQYILEPYKGMNTRHRCPACQHREKTFSKYIDTSTGEVLHHAVGKCNRESKCNYHYTPKQYFTDNNISFNVSHKVQPKYTPPPAKPISYIPIDVFKNSLKSHDKNNFVAYLITLFGVEVASNLVSKYFIGTSKHWNGATVFWQIDTHGKVRTGKVMLYDAIKGKRIKEPFNHINWVHTLLKSNDFELKQCFFGEHLLKDTTKPVAIVESEKTAIIASAYLPKFIWLAVGSLSSLSFDKCKVLEGRKVVLFPDLNGFDKWSIKAKEFQSIASFVVSDLLEQKATDTERQNGLDIADYLVRFPFKNEEPINNTKVEQPAFEAPVLSDTIKKEGTPIEKVNADMFEGIALPNSPIKIAPHITIIDVNKFVDVHLAVAIEQSESPVYLPYAQRLHDFKRIIQNQ
jgi:hypothetical protein